MPVAWILRVLRASQIWTPSKQDDRALSANNVVSTETSATEKDFGYVSIVFHSNQIALKPQVFGLREQGFLKANFSDTTASIIQKPEEHQSIWNMSLDIQRPKLRRWHLDSQNTPKLPHLRRDIFGCFSPIHLYIVSCFHHVCSKNISHLWTISKNHGKALKTRGYITPKNETNVGNPHPSIQTRLANGLTLRSPRAMLFAASPGCSQCIETLVSPICPRWSTILWMGWLFGGPLFC